MIQKPVRLAVVGIGAIGRVHLRAALRVADIELCGLSDVDPAADEFGRQYGVPAVRDFRDLLNTHPEAVLIATPNGTHLEIGRFFAERGMHVLVEKPIADSLSAGAELCRVASHSDVKVLVGHHRRHHGLVTEARRFVAEELGPLVATNTLVTMKKPDSYYELAWRRSEGAGPLLVNLIHEVDLLRSVCGEIEWVQGAGTNVNRRLAFDDTASVVVQLANGALGTIVISDCIPSPWSWEASVTAELGFHNAGQDYAQFMGRDASLAFPSLTAWRYDRHDPEPGWESPLRSHRLTAETGDPYQAQLEHFVRLVRGQTEAMVDGEDGLRSLAVVEAVISAIGTGTRVNVDRLLDNARR